MIPFLFREKKKECPICQAKRPYAEKFHELRLNTADGTHDVLICQECTRFFEKSAEVLNGKKDENDDDAV